MFFTTMIAKKGCVPEDERNFSPESLKQLKTASGHVLYLINEGYDLKQACTFVGNHFLLSERQRLAIMRSVATRDQLEGRRKKLVPFAELAGRPVWIDGFNTVITMEVMLSDSILFSCMDGTVRDLAALRGTYRIIDVTESAVRTMLDCLKEAQVGMVHILLDEPVSNSGRLKTLIAEVGEKYSFDLDITVQKDVDRVLYEKENVVSSDSVILDRCRSWVNLNEACLTKHGVKSFRVW